MKAVDLTGKKFGRLTAISFYGRIANKRFWKCTCECGNEAIVQVSSLTSGNTTSCGCYRDEIIKVSQRRHGLTKTPVHRIWVNMKSRCTNPKVQKYPRYGGRGIKVCERWQVFENFLEDMGDLPFPKAEIDRIDNDGDYEPSNCRWVDRKTNSRNTCANVYWTYQGVTKCISEWAEILGVKVSSLQGRVSRLGWSIEKTLSTPVVIGRNQYSGSA